LAVIVSDAILVEHRPPGLLKVDLVRGDGHIDADRVVA
jgi:hypothetical protein